MRSFLMLLSRVLVPALGLMIGAGVPLTAQRFAAPVVVSAGSQPVFLASADVNGDGMPDLISIDAGATAEQSTTRILLGDGRGGFRESARLATAGTTVAVGDLLGTGHVDVGWITSSVSSNLMTASFLIAHGVGDGSFAAPRSSLPAQTTFAGVAPVVEHLQAARLSASGPVRVFFQFAGSLMAFDPASPGSFLSEPADVVARLNGSGPLTVADLNGDGFSDLIVNSVSNTSAAAEVALSHADRMLSGEVSGQFRGAGGVRSMVFGDFNGDGIPDIAAEGASGRVDLFAGNGDGSFSGTSLGGVDGGGHLVVAADLNGDGDLDLVTYTPAGVAVLLGSADHRSAPHDSRFVLHSTSGAGAGPHQQWVAADFNGDGRLDLATDAPGGIAILLGEADDASVDTLTANPEPSAFEASFTLNAAILEAAGASAGSVEFTLDGVTVGTAPAANGAATVNVPAVAATGKPVLPGSHVLGATYRASGTTTALALTGAHVVERGPTTVTLTPTTAPTIYFGGAIDGTFAVDVQDPSYPATGTYTLLDNGVPTAICTNLPLTAQCPYGNPVILDAGPHAFVIQYNGDAINAPGASVPQVYNVLPDLTSVAGLVSSLNPAVVGTPITFTVRLKGNLATPTGTVTFLDGAKVIGAGTLNGAGSASLTTSTLAVGSHPITAAYAGNVNFNPVTTGVLNQVVTQEPRTAGSATVLQSSVNPSSPGQAVTFTATVDVPGPLASLIPAGTVSFRDGAALLGTATLDGMGRARLTTATLAPGTHPVTAAYGGDGANILASTSAVLNQVVGTSLTAAPTGFNLTVSPNPVRMRAGGTVEMVVGVAESGVSVPVTLACAGLPRETTCVFGQATIPAGGGSTILALTTARPHPCDSNVPYGGSASCPGRALPLLPGGSLKPFAIGVPALAGLLIACVPRRRRRLMVLLLSLAGVAALSGCGNCTDLGTALGKYHFAVVGTSPTQTKSVTVDLTVTDP